MNNTIVGTAQVFSRDDIDTDLIIPAHHLTTSDAKELAQHALEPLGNDDLLESDYPIVIAGNNFGCGSSREHAVWALAGAGVKAVIADSFARIFFRNSINFGLPTFILAKAADKFDSDDKIEIDLEKKVIRNVTKNEEHSYEPLPDFLEEIVTAGGLLNKI
jgi:3-isopropylmalate/(R)-2-methylmalate dehydratase small subunit